MFIHLGGDMVLKADVIIAIIDHHSHDLSKENQRFLQDHIKRKKTIKVTEDIPKSIIVTKDDIYLSPISSLTLKRRAETAAVIPEEE
ncbi:DUF370 domain-containing protein [Salipaludibacillus neizhouensis]|uniref:DUF370 domain-containing protein n=1 Tax=Salipaludibacillus neizhouensis TaxID=885475 RepID=A0A3A9K583_9BACI|nr:extracellular matrix/biofilm biosynthesis regulator RemA family protein [Salipaludibacillus neizhouensis]RKL66010.1 DUF370 domain-containing protein [Salipaludibacillus neizhouensis]